MRFAERILHDRGKGCEPGPDSGNGIADQLPTETTGIVRNPFR
jgi:hypothetical protein